LKSKQNGLIKMKVLNLYAGVGGNRKLWEDVEVTAVEIVPEIAAIYQDFFPDDTVIVGDAHQYLLEHYDEFDFIWASPPCPSHSKVRRCFAVTRGQSPPIYPDMRLYQEILFLQGYCKSLYCVENVVAWYDPLIRPQLVGRHYFWANFFITDKEIPSTKIGEYGATQDYWIERYGFDLSKYDLNGLRRDTLYKNIVDPELGNHVLKCARGNTVIPLTSFSKSKRIP